MNILRTAWSSSEFETENITRYAQPEVRREAGRGIVALGVLMMLVMSGLALLYYGRGLAADCAYTFLLLALLAVHVAVSARLLRDTTVLYLLGMVLLALCGLGFVLLAHRHGLFSASMFSTVVLLFLVVPLVPWGVREALAAIGVLYAMFTISTLTAASRFGGEALWTLQFLMVSSATIALTLVARNIIVRKAHLEAEFSLTATNAELHRLSHQDALTGAWNRRFLEENFQSFAARAHATGMGYCLGLVDLDRFKSLNDRYGHACGDRVLQWLATLLANALAPDEYVVRMGGDEFAVLLNGRDARQRLERVLHTLGEQAGERPAPAALLGASIGLARVHAPSSARLPELYALADQALYSAKARPSSVLVELQFEPGAT